MCLQLPKARPSAHAEEDHLEGTLGWASTGVNQDQDASDDRTVNLYLYSVLLGGELRTTGTLTGLRGHSQIGTTGQGEPDYELRIRTTGTLTNRADQKF